MSKKFWMFFLSIIGNFNLNSLSDFKNKKQKKDSSFVSITPSKNVFKNYFPGVFFVTKNGLKIKYYGSKYSKKYLLYFVKDCNSREDEYVLLASLLFDSMSFEEDEAGNLYLEIQDSLNVEEVEFVVSYRDDNIIKNKTYSKNGKKITSYYSNYLQMSGLNLENQVIDPIRFKTLKIALEKLSLHFLRLGYSYVDVGYEIIQNKTNGNLKIVYKIDLDDLQENSIKINGGEDSINSLLKRKIQRYMPAIFEVSGNALYLPQFKDVIKSVYESYGYFNVSSSSYFDIYIKEINISINSGDCFKINDFLVDTSSLDFSIISEKKVNDVKKIVKSLFKKNNGTYSDKKIQQALNSFNDLCSNLDYYVTPSISKDFDKKEIFVSFIFQRKNIALKKILKSVKCVGNSKISSIRIMSYLNKKLGDLVSTDDLYSIKQVLFSTGCFEDVKTKLRDCDDGYCLDLELKEGHLFNIGNFNFTPYPEWGLSVSGGKKNAFDSGKNVNAVVTFQKSSESDNQYGALYLDFEEKLPNGKDFSFGVGLQYSGKFKNLLSKDEKKTLIFDQESGGKCYVYLTSEFLNFDHNLELGFRYFKVEKKGSPYVCLKTDLWNYVMHRIGSYLQFSVSNEAYLYFSDYKKPFDVLNANLQYVSSITEDEKLYLIVLVQIGHLFSSEHCKLGKYHVFQTLNGSELGNWGPEKNGFIIGGDTKVGIKVSINYNLNLAFLPDFLQKLLPYAEFESGSMFNFKDKDFNDNFVYGFSFGIQVPIVKGQIVLKFYYFVPLHNKTGPFLTKQGLQFNLAVDMSQVISF